jgi:hypothetical protein
MKYPKIPLNYGTIGAILYFSLFVLIYYTGGQPLGEYALFGIWILPVFIYLGIKYHRDKERNGFIAFTQALGAGMLISFVLASLFNILVYSFGTFIGRELMPKYEMNKLEKLEELKISIERLSDMGNSSLADSMQKVYDMETDNMKKHPEEYTLGNICWRDFQAKLFGGFFVSLFIALILKKKADVPI